MYRRKPDGKLYVKYQWASGNNGYLNAMKIEWEKGDCFDQRCAGQPKRFPRNGECGVVGHGERSGSGIPGGREIVSVTINGVTQHATITGGVGAFSVSIPVSSLAVGTYPITYGYVGSTVLKGATHTSTVLTVIPAIYTMLVDLGRHDGGINGRATANPDCKRKILEQYFLPCRRQSGHQQHRDFQHGHQRR
jgi:hypothetical protein